MTAAQEQAARQELKDLIDCLPAQELLGVKRYIQYVSDLQDPLLKLLYEAPLDDEPLTQEDLAAIKEAKEDIAAGRLITVEQLKRELGI